MDYLVLDEPVAIHNKAVAKAENELALLGALCLGAAVTLLGRALAP